MDYKNSLGNKWIGIGLFTLFYSYGIVLAFLEVPHEAWVKTISTLFLLLPLIFLPRPLLKKELVPTFIGTLVLCAIGDFLLVHNKYNPTDGLPIFFILGLGFYLVGYFFIGISLFKKGLKNSYTWIVTGVFSLLSYLQFQSLNNLEEGLVIPVILYLLQATILVVGSAAYAQKHQGLPKVLFILGGLSIYLSDSIIGQDLFGGGVPLAQLWISLTYMVGLIALLWALLLRKENLPAS